MGATTVDVRSILLMLLARRAVDATICPSEVARALAATDGGDWRGTMPAVHAAADMLLTEGRIRLSWKGVSLAHRSGPYRIGRGERSD